MFMKVDKAVRKLMAARPLDLAKVTSVVDEELLKHMIDEDKLYLVLDDESVWAILDDAFPRFAYKELKRTATYRDLVSQGYKEKNPLKCKFYDIVYDPLSKGLFGYMHLMVRMDKNPRSKVANTDIKIEYANGTCSVTTAMPNTDTISLKQIFSELLEQHPVLET